MVIYQGWTETTDNYFHIKAKTNKSSILKIQ